MQAVFERSMSHNYMIPEIEGGIQAEGYQVRMLLENSIEGLLPVSVKNVNCSAKYYYDITSRLSMKQLFETETLGDAEIKVILRGLYSVLKELKKYLLDGNKLILEPEWIYLDVESRKPYFCYMPSYDGNLGKSFERLAEYILHTLNQTSNDTVLLGYEIYRQTKIPNYNLEELLKKVTGEIKEEIKEKEKEEKKEENTLQEKGLVKKPDIPERKIAEEKPSKKLRPVWKEKTQPKQQKRDRSLLLWGSILICMLVLIYLAFWFEVLDVTQAGGLTFLLIGLTGYGVSAQKKQKKEKPDLEGKTRDKRTEKSQIEQIDQVEKRKTVPESLNRKKQEHKEEPIEFGATMVLEEGTGEYQPHLGLISMNSKDRNSLVLIHDQYLIGKRKGKVDLCIDSPTISRLHAKIIKTEDGYLLCDMNSTNGTFLNGRRLEVNEQVPIKLSDEIHFAEIGYYVGEC